MPCTSGTLSSPFALFRDRESSCLPTNPRTKGLFRPSFLGLHLRRELSAQLTIPIFFSAHREDSLFHYLHAPNIELRILRQKMKVNLETLLFDIVPVSRPQHSVRRDFLNNRMASLEVARHVLLRFSRATALCLTLYGRRESYRPMVSAKKCLYI